MSWTVFIKPSAKRDLERLPRSVVDRIDEKLLLLEETPFPSGARKLKGHDEYRIRVGDYRAVYQINHETNEIYVTRIAHRREVYR